MLIDCYYKLAVVTQRLDKCPDWITLTRSQLPGLRDHGRLDKIFRSDYQVSRCAAPKVIKTKRFDKPIEIDLSSPWFIKSITPQSHRLDKHRRAKQETRHIYPVYRGHTGLDKFLCVLGDHS